MENGHFRILCIGKDRFLLELRCQVLSRTGYYAQAAFIPEAYERLRSMRFDLVITTKELAEKHREDLYAAVPLGIQVLLLDGLTFPADLLAAVAETLFLSRIGQDNQSSTGSSKHSA
jgi:hypothetical protein